jgi:hypothetical protein
MRFFEKENRRLKMPVLKGIPGDVFIDHITIEDKELDRRVKQLQSADKLTLQGECMDLQKEKEYLTAAVQYLKDSIS